VIESGVMTADTIKVMDAEVLAEVEDAYKFAEEAPDPAPEELYTDVYAPEHRET
jgi:pyruvate dehydrogenase E1 component alpha subunit